MARLRRPRARCLRDCVCDFLRGSVAAGGAGVTEAVRHALPPAIAWLLAVPIFAGLGGLRFQHGKLFRLECRHRVRFRVGPFGAALSRRGQAWDECARLRGAAGPGPAGEVSASVTAVAVPESAACLYVIDAASVNWGLQGFSLYGGLTALATGSAGAKIGLSSSPKLSGRGRSGYSRRKSSGVSHWAPGRAGWSSLPLWAAGIFFLHSVAREFCFAGCYKTCFRNPRRTRPVAGSLRP